MDNLKPCPFCGTLPACWDDDGVFMVYCANEDCVMFSADNMSVASWDTRPLEDALLEQLYALSFLDWTVVKRSLYDEEGVEGWTWIEPNGNEHTEIGSWDELPPWPDSARAAIAKAKGSAE